MAFCRRCEVSWVVGDRCWIEKCGRLGEAGTFPRRWLVVVDRFDELVKQGQPHGGDRRSADRTKIDNVNLDVPDGNSRATALRRLRKDRPDLHEQVLAGELSPHKAMVNAGFRRRTATVPVDDPQAAARTIRRQFEHDALVQLVAALIEPEEGP